MKKFMFTIIFTLTAVMFSQQVYRLNDSKFVYPCITTDSTDYNMIGLPLKSNYVNASDFDPSGTNIEAVSWYDLNNQYYQTAVYNPYFGWIKDFPVQTGGAYFINAKNNFDFTVTGDSVNVVYDLKNTITTDLNYIVLPITEANLTTSAMVGTDIGASTYCNAVGKWNVSTQQFKVCVYTLGPWKQVYNTYVGDPLWLNITNSKTWPSLKSENDGSAIDEKNSKGVVNSPRIVFIHLVDDSGNELTDEEMKLIQFEAKIVSRPAEILTENSFDCGFTKIGGLSVAYVNLGSFPTPWLSNIGDLYFTLTNFDPMEGYELQFTLDKYSSTSIYKGFEPLIAGSGTPGYLDMSAVNPLTTPAVTTTVLDNTITLDWGYVAEATGYSIYASDEPYGTYNLITTVTGITWATSVADAKKFFYVVSTNAKSSVPPKTIELKEKK